MIGFNGGLIGKLNLSAAQASNPGVWTIREQEVARRAGRWSGQELLDNYPGSTAAFSLRSLSGRTSGANLIEVRRSTDSAVSDFTAEQINDTGAGGMLAWVTESSATASGFVSKWYDQSGFSNHAVQATTSLQPRIVNAGALELEVGKPAIVFGSADGVSLVPPSITIGATAAFFSVTRHTNAGGTFSWYVANSTSGTFFLGKTNATAQAGYLNNAAPGISGTNIVQKTIAYWQLGAGISEYKLNGAGAALADHTPSADWRIGGRGSATSQKWVGPIQEIIYYPTSQVSTNSAIISAMNDYYIVF